ncbi:MAG: benzoylformate decarboxylase [Pseudomonadota bacterium]
MSDGPEYTVREAVFDLLRQLDIKVIFGNPGSTELPFFRSFPEDFRYVLGLQELVAVGMADGHAQAAHNAALVNLHSAAGVGHAMGGIFTAFKNCTPMIITAGQQARSMQPFDPFLHSAQATLLPQPYVKWSVEPARAEDVPQAIARAYYIAMMPPRGPVLVSIPADDWDRPATRISARKVSTAVMADTAMLCGIGAALQACARPAFVVGDAVDRDLAWDAMVALAERHQARVFASPMMGRCSFPEDHRLYAGVLPAAREGIVQALDGHDLVLVVGAPAFLNHIEGHGPVLPAGASLFQVVDDPTLAAWAPVGTAVVGSIRLCVEGLLQCPPPVIRSQPAVRPALSPASAPAGGRMSADYVMQVLHEVRSPDDIIVEEAPSSRPAMQRYLPITRSAGFFACSSGGLGFGMAAAVGLALAQNQGGQRRRVIAVIGDGSAMYAPQALWSAVQLKLPMTFIILRNGVYAAMHSFAGRFGFAPDDIPPGTLLPGLDYVLLAQGQGCDARRVSSAAQLRSALQEALASTVPLLLEIEIA